MDTNMLAVLAIVVVLLVVAGLLLTRKRRSEKLEERFGPEYQRTLDTHGSRTKAEAELLARQKRVDQLNIVPLAPAEAARYTESWKSLQARFVDSPQGVLFEADQLVRDLMQRRGYPMGDFDTRAADISVHHPSVVDHYRAAHAIAMRDQRGEADTEALRQAIVHYRALFAELLEVEQPVQQREVRRTETRTEPRTGMPGRDHAMAQREPRPEPMRGEAPRNDREIRR
jgi:hypothetical protein